MKKILIQEKIRKSYAFAAILLFSSYSWAQQYPFQNPELSSEERAKDLISRLTLEEKAILMCDVSEAIPRLGIKKFNWWSEALHGLANNSDVTVFPEPIGMAASFDDELVYRIFSATSDETRAKYNEERQKGLENRRFMSLSVWTPNKDVASLSLVGVNTYRLTAKNEGTCSIKATTADGEFSAECQVNIRPSNIPALWKLDDIKDNKASALYNN